MYVFNWSLSPNIYFILYVRNFQKFIYPRNYLSKTYKIIQFSNVRFQIMYVFRKNVQNASFPCGCHVSHSNFILYVFFNFPSKFDVSELKGMIEEHVAATNSETGKEILDHFKEYLPKFKKIIPRDYERMLTRILQLEEKGLSSEQAKTEAFYAIKEGR